jgi:hypothetical protein
MNIKNLIISLLLVLPFLLPLNIFAASYTRDEVATHDSPSDCWMIFEQSVYDITSYLRSHDRYLEIDSWCGEDMTNDFMTKAGTGRYHKSSTYALLEQYKIGDLVGNTTSPTPTLSTINITNSVKPTERAASNDISEPKDPYNLAMIVLITVIFYWGWYFLCKRNYQCSLFKVTIFNFFWNSVLLITLIPAVGFGFFMVLRYSFPSLYELKFDFLFWHVEGSLIMGTIAISHFLTRLSAYFAQMRMTLSKKS